MAAYPIIRCRCYRFPRENRCRGEEGLLINAIYAGIDETRERNVAVCIEEGREGGGFNCTEFLLARAERAPNKTLISVFDYTQTDRSEYGSGIPLPRRKLGTTTRDQLSLIRIDRRWPAG